MWLEPNELIDLRHQKLGLLAVFPQGKDIYVQSVQGDQLIKLHMIKLIHHKVLLAP